MKDTKGKTLQVKEEGSEPQVELHFTILEESEGGISQGKLWPCEIDAEPPPESSRQPDVDDELLYSDQSRPSKVIKRTLPEPDRRAQEERMEMYSTPTSEQQVELHFTILEESEGGISEGKLCASEIPQDESPGVNYQEQWDRPLQWSEKADQPPGVKESLPAEDRPEDEAKRPVLQPESSDQQVEVHFTIFDDPEEKSPSQGPEDYPVWESPFKPAHYQGDSPKEIWDAPIESLGEVFEASLQQQFYSEGKLYPCTECGRVFNRKSTLTRHWRTHTGEKPYSCPYCGRSFSLNLNLITHQMTHTGEKPYKCPDCGQCFTRSTSVTRHQRSHREEGLLKNDLWEEPFSYPVPVPFTYPMPVVVEEKSFLCPVCGEAFTHSGSLSRHLQTHGMERPYKCMICGEGFCSMSKLYRHERLHLVDKPYNCEICGKSFAVKSTLTRHQMLHQAMRPYMCSHCEKGYVQRSHLARHHYKAHPEIPFNPVKANLMPATILDSDNLITYFWGDEETDTTTTPEPVPTQLIYSGAAC
ncbi:zinc finger protein 79-like [Erythrolamprus reginae]|uniref:zinc finger protein 79-like n=1 Tax=Erythrolamprus reginae TaxID=121349 RepID=UPI00396CC2CE